METENKYLLSTKYDSDLYFNCADTNPFSSGRIYTRKYIREIIWP